MQGSTTSRPGGDLDREAKLPLIAVIAVHGVADQAPNESARQIAELLLRKRYSDGAAMYSSFREQSVRIPVDPPLEPIPEAAKQKAVPDHDAPRLTGSDSSLDIEFTDRLLRQYSSKKTPYDTVRLEGHRLREPEGSPEQTVWIDRDQCHVHVYELFWADLSRLGTGIVGFFGAVFQLISSLAQLGMRTVTQASHAHASDKRSARWDVYRHSHAFAVWLLTVVVPFLNLALLGTALAILVVRAPRGVHAFVLALIVFVFPLGLRTWILLRAKRAPGTTRRKGPSLIWLLLSAAVGVAVFLTLRRASGALSLWFVAYVWILLQTVSLVMLARVYVARIKTALAVGLVISVGAAIATILATFRVQDAGDYAHGAMRTIELLFFGLFLSWIMLTAAGIISALAAVVVVLRERRHPQRARRSVWTAQSTLAVSTASLSALSLFAWSVLYHMLSASLPAPPPGLVPSPKLATVADPSVLPAARTITSDTSYRYTPRMRLVLLTSRRSGICFDAGQAPASRVASCRNFSLKTFLRTLLTASAIVGLAINGIGLCLTAAISLWLALPSAIRELRFAKKPTDVNRSVALGVWLTIGFRQLRWAAIGVYAWIFAGTGLVIAFGLWTWLQAEAARGLPVTVLQFLQPIGDTFVFGFGSFIAASTVGIAALLTRFESVAKVLRPALDVSLDVDNYLKSRPAYRTPRARMMERFVALLRYVTRWRRDGAGYDAIIIVAHSQGTVLSGDLLRYQQKRGFKNLSFKTGYKWKDRAGNEQLASQYVDFFTMGSPLRQLYTSSFPDLFAWTDLSAKCTPDESRLFCDKLGVRRWWNVYRSGDYVGRALWQYGGEERHYVPDEWHEKGDSCREKCLGVGAHTHYWNENGGDVADVLDELISAAHEASPRKKPR